MTRKWLSTILIGIDAALVVLLIVLLVKSHG